MKQCPKCNLQCDDVKIYCPNCGNLLKSVVPPAPPVPEREANSGKKLLPILLVMLLIGNVIFGIAWCNSSEDADYYYTLYRSMQSNYITISSSYDFYDQYARVVPDDDSGLYHRYGCSWLDTSYFWIYNVDSAKSKASPCPNCCADD